MKEAIISVVSQTFEDFELIIVNDGSDENIDHLVIDSRIKIIKKDNGGPASARNIGIDLSNGKFIAFLDSDDLWLKDKLEVQIGMMEKYNWSWSHHSYKKFWESSSRIEDISTKQHRGNVYLQTFVSFKVVTGSVVIRKKVLDDYNISYNEKNKIW